MKRATSLVRDPLFIFLVLGAGIFALDHFRSRLPGSSDDLRIEVTAGDISRLRELWRAQAKRPAAETELRALIEDYVREEILNREARRLGLDRNDVIIRRRLAQKMAFLLEDRSSSDSPDEGTLQQFYESHPEMYEQPELVTFEHVYFQAERSEDIQSALRELRKYGRAGTAGRPMGDPFLLPLAFREQPKSAITELFGETFATALERVGVNRWSGPLESAYGSHLVLISHREPAHRPPFGKVREQVLLDYQADQRTKANHDIYRELRGRYRVHVAQEGVDAGGNR